MVAAQAIGRPSQRYLADPLSQLFKKDAYLQSGDVGAQTKVRAAPTKRNVIVWRPVDEESLRVVEVRLVAIARDVIHGDLVASRDVGAVEFDVDGGSAAHEMNGSGPAQDFVGGDEAVEVIRTETVPLVWILGDSGEAVGQCVCRVVSLPATTSIKK